MEEDAKWGASQFVLSSPDIIKEIKSWKKTCPRGGRHLASMGEERSAYRYFVGMPEGKTPHGGPRRRWNNGIKIDSWGTS